MSDPIEKMCWTCGFCGQPHRSRDVALQCCTCRVCGSSDVSYTGSRSHCRKCMLKKNLAEAKTYVAGAKETLEILKEQAKELGISDD